MADPLPELMLLATRAASQMLEISIGMHDARHELGHELVTDLSIELMGISARIDDIAEMVPFTVLSELREIEQEMSPPGEDRCPTCGAEFKSGRE